MKFLLLLILVINIFSLKVRSSYGLVNYDLVTFAQVWPQTACWVINDKWQFENCNPCDYIPKTHPRWTIHGLWPSKRDGNHPYFCNQTNEFNEKLLSSDLIAKLNEKWPNFDFQTNNVGFWKHEWDKHGTCAKDIENTNTLPKYFSKTLEISDRYNIGKILKMSGIVPRSHFLYEIDDIVRALKRVLDVRVHVSCAANKLNKRNYLDQIYICFDKSLRLMDCEENKIDCIYGNQVIYPEILKPCSEFRISDELK